MTLFSAHSLARMSLRPVTLAVQLALALPLATALAAPAQAEQTASIRYDIPAGPLGQSLNAIAARSGELLTFTPAQVAGRSAPAVHGEFTLGAALERALTGSGLRAVIAEHGIALEPLPAPDTTLAPVKVRASGLGATEGTGSYTASAVSAGSKMEQSLREIPRSISVIGRQQLDDQRITSFEEAIEQLPGTTFSPTTDGWGVGSITVRGHALTSVMVDGSPSRGQSDGDGSFNTGMAKYDNIQLLRGPDGLFSGNGQPSGSINLVRKRPLDERQLKTALSVGRWDNYLGEVDISSPLSEDGRLRARAVASYNDTQKFFDNADRRNSTLYGIVEYDLAERTTLGAGVSQDKRWGDGQDQAPSFPRYVTGEPLPLSRRQGMAAYSKRDTDSLNYFASLSHALNDAWSLKIGLSRTESDGETIPSYYSGGVDPTTGAGSVFNRSALVKWEADSNAADFNITGDFDLWSRQGKIVFGADYVKTSNSTVLSWTTLETYGAQNIPIDWGTFNPNSLENYTVEAPFSRQGSENTQGGAYFYGSLPIVGPLKAVLGGRYAYYDNQRKTLPTGGVATFENNKNDDIFTPYYALIYDFADNWSGYITTTESYENQSHLYSDGYQSLDPATGRSLELGIKGEHWDGKLNSNITAYRSKRRNVGVSIGTDQAFSDANPGKSCCYDGSGKFVAQGVEMDISGELLPGLQINLGYTFDDNEVKYGNSAGDRFTTNTPKHILRAWGRYQLHGSFARLAVGGGVKAQSNFFRSGTVRTWNPTGGANGNGAYTGPTAPYEFTEPGRAVWNAFAEYRLHDNWTAALNVNNLFDKRYFQKVTDTRWGNVYGEPRNVLFTVRGSFH